MRIDDNKYDCKRSRLSFLCVDITRLSFWKV